ncbi:ATPase synthesis protein 25 [Fusarium oxysporum f. sp. albedinis]|nr:ATPase synthesis protein 25 [Fusarium oxysporum f. sp. albedinis]
MSVCRACSPHWFVTFTYHDDELALLVCYWLPHIIRPSRCLGSLPHSANKSNSYSSHVHIRSHRFLLRLLTLCTPIRHIDSLDSSTYRTRHLGRPEGELPRLQRRVSRYNILLVFLLQP